MKETAKSFLKRLKPLHWVAVVAVLLLLTNLLTARITKDNTTKALLLQQFQNSFGQAADRLEAYLESSPEQRSSVDLAEGAAALRSAWNLSVQLKACGVSSLFVFATLETDLNRLCWYIMNHLSSPDKLIDVLPELVTACQQLHDDPLDRTGHNGWLTLSRAANQLEYGS